MPGWRCRTGTGPPTPERPPPRQSRADRAQAARQAPEERIGPRPVPIGIGQPEGQHQARRQALDPTQPGPREAARPRDGAPVPDPRDQPCPIAGRVVQRRPCPMEGSLGSESATVAPAEDRRYRCRRGRPSGAFGSHIVSRRPRPASRMSSGYNVPDLSPVTRERPYPCCHCAGCSPKAILHEFAETIELGGLTFFNSI